MPERITHTQDDHQIHGFKNEGCCPGCLSESHTRGGLHESHCIIQAGNVRTHLSSLMWTRSTRYLMSVRFTHPHTTTGREEPIIGGSCQMYNFCSNKSFVMTNMCLCLSWQNVSFVATKVSFWRNKSFLVTNICCNKHMFVVKKGLSWQAYFCHDKGYFVATKVSLLQQNLCRDKIMFVATKVLSQVYFCCDKRHVLSGQTWVCYNKTFVATKKILVAAPTGDRSWGWG